MYGSFLCTIMGKKKQAQGHEAICPRSHSHEGAICCYSSTQISTEHLLSARQLPGEDRPNEAGVTGDKPICRAQQTSHRAKPCCSTECKVHALVILACTSPLSAPCPVPVTNNRKQHHSRAWPGEQSPRQPPWRAWLQRTSRRSLFCICTQRA